MQKTITIEDVFASADKYGEDGVLDCNLKKVRDLKTLNPNSKYDTTYIPLVFKHINGKTMPVKIKFSEQIISSSAKPPQGNDDGGIPKHLNISFLEMKKGDIEGGDYVPKEKNTPELQEKENLRVNSNIERYMTNNKKFLRVLSIVDKSYKKVCSDLKAKAKSLNFRIKKDRNQNNITVFSIRQNTRLNLETNQDEELETPIYRLKLPVHKEDGKIGIWSKYYNTFKYIVFDARKMNKKNNYQPVPAKVKVEGSLRDLDVNNAKSFITYKSLIGGHITFECITASKFGLSLNNSFYDLYVYRHKSKATQPTLTKEDIIQLRGGHEDDEEDEEDSDAELLNSDEEKEEEDEEKDDSGNYVSKPVLDSDDDDDDEEGEEGEEGEEDEKDQ